MSNFHLKNITLNKIFCFNHLEAEFNKINIILADNGCGKTYLLRCLDLIGSKANDYSSPTGLRLALYAILSQILNIEEYIRNDIVLATKFLGYGFKNQKESFVTATIDDIEYSLFPRDSESTTIDYQNILDLLKSYSEETSQSVTDLRLKNRQQFVAYLSGESLWQDTAKKMNQDLNNNIKLRDDFLLKAVQIFQPKAKAISAAPDGLNIFFDNLTNPLPIGTQGYGLKRLVNCLFMIACNHNRFFAIDEAESGLHFTQYFDNANYLISGAKQFNTQLFITTHSREYAIALAEVIKEEKMESETSFLNLINTSKDESDELLLKVQQYQDLDKVLEDLKNTPDFFRMV
jgi:AAA15 family ATPase/GTPase